VDAATARLHAFVFAGSGAAPGTVDRADADALLCQAADLAARAPEACGLLATHRLTGGSGSTAPATRVVLLKSPFGVERDGDDVSVLFHTTRRSRKHQELLADPQATLTYWDPSRLAYVTFTGTAEQLGAPEASGLFSPLLRLFYPEGPDAPGSSYTAWRLRASNIQLVAIPGIESARDDWRPVELAQDGISAKWKIVCDGL
jgi:general stress protein 26